MAKQAHSDKASHAAAQYGDGKTYTAHGLSTEGLHTVENHRIQMLVKFTF